MLQGLFNYDNPVWRFIGKLGDLILLNILWLVCSIPLVTIGASTTAVYYVTLKLVRDEDGGTIKSFFHSFKQNFVQATAIWLILILAGLLIGFDLWFFLTGHMGVAGLVKTVIAAIFGALAFVWMFVFTYIFAIQARFYNPVKKTFFNAFFMSVRHLFRTIAIVVIDAAVAATGYFSLFYAPQLFLLLVLFGMPLIAFINSYFFTAIFKQYMPKEKTESANGLSPLMDTENKEVEEAIQSLKKGN